MRRFELRDDQWERIKDLLPGRVGSVGVTAADNRRFVEAVLYRYRTGMPWRDLPERFGDGTKVHLRFSRWAKSGVWERVFQHLITVQRYSHVRRFKQQACKFLACPSSYSAWPLLGKAGGTIMKRRLIML